MEPTVSYGVKILGRRKVERNIELGTGPSTGITLLK
jgi:hypothetical protein